MTQDRRRHKRFSATAFLNAPVYLNPLPPFFGHPVVGKLIDLSAGGMALLIDEIIPQGSQLMLAMTFPDRAKLETLVSIRRVIPRSKEYLVGIEFMNVPDYMVEKITKMSTDYIDCETRIQSKITDVCQLSCAFFPMCTKSQKIEPIVNWDVGLELAFKALEESPVKPV